ncbi:MAG: hypothetical protein R2867_06460 [Caldilineaceae bacterium]
MSETYVPEEYLGTVINDFGTRHGQVQQMAVSGDGTRTVTAMTPLTEMIGYATTLRSITSGRGTFTMELHHYAEASEAIHERILGRDGRTDFILDRDAYFSICTTKNLSVNSVVAQREQRIYG